MIHRENTPLSKIVTEKLNFSSSSRNSLSLDRVRFDVCVCVDVWQNGKKGKIAIRQPYNSYSHCLRFTAFSFVLQCCWCFVLLLRCGQCRLKQQILCNDNVMRLIFTFDTRTIKAHHTHSRTHTRNCCTLTPSLNSQSFSSNHFVCHFFFFFSLLYVFLFFGANFMILFFIFMFNFEPQFSFFQRNQINEYFVLFSFSKWQQLIFRLVILLFWT